MKARLTLPVIGLMAAPISAQELNIPDFSGCDDARNKLSCVEQIEAGLLENCETDNCGALVMSAANRIRLQVLLTRTDEIRDKVNFNTGFGIGIITFSD